MKTLIKITAAVLMAFAAPAYAGDDHGHGHGDGDKGARGGVLGHSGHHHLELVAKDGSLELYVEGEDGEPEDVAGAKAAATVLSKGKKEDVPLSATPEKVLKGAGGFTVSKGMTVVVTLTMPDHKPEQVRFKFE